MDGEEKRVRRKECKERGVRENIEKKRGGDLGVYLEKAGAREPAKELPS